VIARIIGGAPGTVNQHEDVRVIQKPDASEPRVSRAFRRPQHYVKALNGFLKMAAEEKGVGFIDLSEAFVWTLKIYDKGYGGIGYLNKWDMKFF
jgi:hypothetical protein